MHTSSTGAARHPAGGVEDPPDAAHRRNQTGFDDQDEINVGSVGLKIGPRDRGGPRLYIYTGGRTKIWDTCGPEAILLAARRKMTDVDGDR